MKNEYFDEYGLLHPQRNKKSENGILYLAYYLELKGPTQEEIEKFKRGALAHYINNKWCQTPWTPNDPISHDNMTAIFCFFYKYLPGEFFKYKELENLPRFFHPRDFVIYNYMFEKKWAKHFLFIPALAMLFSCWKYWEDKPYPVYSTSTKLLAWYRCWTLELTTTNQLCNVIIKLRHKSWKHVFAYYFKDENHPINKLWYEKT